jgi:hypothetical protein
MLRASTRPALASSLPSKSSPSFVSLARRLRTSLTLASSLPESKDDRALEAAVTREFSRYGTVFVKIRREAKGSMTGMPYAFAQFTVSYRWSLQGCLTCLTTNRATTTPRWPWRRVVAPSSLVALAGPRWSRLIVSVADPFVNWRVPPLMHPSRHLRHLQPPRRRDHHRHRSGDGRALRRAQQVRDAERPDAGGHEPAHGCPGGVRPV